MTALEAVTFLSVVLGVLLTAAFGVIAFMVRTLYTVQTRLAVLNETIKNFDEGATKGARALINSLAGRIDTAEDAVEQLGERLHDVVRDVAINRERINRLHPGP